MFITPSFKKSLIVEQFQGNYLNLFLELNLVAVSLLLLLPSFVAMAYGELVQIERESFLTSAAILDCVALVEVFCHNISLSRFKYCRS